MSLQDKGDFLAEPKAPPQLNIPASKHTVAVSIVDSEGSGTRLDFPVSAMLVPGSVGDWSRFTFTTWSFLIRHPASGKTLLFDLGLRKDWTNLPTKLVEKIKTHDPAWKPHAEWDVVEELGRGGVDVSAGHIDEVIWSHYHWDHVGDMTLFPSSTKLVVGPGFKEKFPVAWPTDEDAFVREDAWAGRELVELSFADSSLKLGRFEALDYFGDGSFYLLDLPGHCVAHIGALARTTEDTFIFMGGDSSHHSGRLRPSDYLPLPKSLTLEPPPDGNFDPPTKHPFPIPCPGELVQEKLHPRHSATKAFFTEKPGFNDDDETCAWTTAGLVEFDASDDVLMVIAHDADLKGVIDNFPVKANDWKVKRWAEKSRWRFLGNFADALES